jgi:hypothetical protein
MTVDPFTEAALEDPYPLYEELRRDTPVYRLPETGIWMVTRHDDLVEAAGKPEIFSSHISAIIYAGQGTNPAVIPADPDAIGAVDVLATQDPPVHTVQRKLLSRTFTQKKIEALTPEIRRFVDAALDRALPAGTIEWMNQVANPLPVSLIAAILGFPPGDLDALKRWADAGVDLLSGVATPERMMEAWQEMIGFLAYLRERIAAPESGSVTADIAAAAGRNDLSDREGVSLLLQLVIAGSESTASLMGSAARLLAENEELQKAMRSDPAALPTFLEEALRLESPFRGHFRVTTRDTELGGVRLPEGARVMLMWGSANRDEKTFERPAELDAGREHLKSHVAFGAGIHFCIGAPLARLEARIAFERLLERTSAFRIAGTRPRHVPSLFVRRLAALPLALEA